MEFAKKREVRVHLVAHPRKDNGKRDMEADDVSGTGDVTNLADNVFSLKRLSVAKAEKKGFSCGLKFLKNRAFGNHAAISLDFEPGSRRYYKAKIGSPDWKFGWEFD